MLTRENPRTTRSRNEFLCSIKEEGYTLPEGSGYRSSGEHVALICPNGHAYSVTPNKFQQGRRCPRCSGYAKKDTEVFKEEVKHIDDSYSVIGEYINARTPLLMKHTCGSEIRISPTNFLRGKRCRTCSIKRRGLASRTSHSDFSEKIDIMTAGEYEVISEYVVSKKKVRMRHNACGHEWEVYPLNFTFHNSRCPCCNESKGEMEIAEYLDRNKVRYERYKKFRDLRYKRQLECDFYLPDHKAIIEFDGGQHYYPVEHFGGEKAFKEVQKRDKTKNEYAKNNNLKMIRIPYWDLDKIGSTLDKELKTLKAAQ